MDKIETKDFKRILKKIKKSELTRELMIDTFLKNINLISLQDLQFLVKKMELNYSGNKKQLIARIMNKIPFSVKTKILLEEKTKNLLHNIDSKKNNLLSKTNEILKDFDKKKFSLISLSLIVVLLGLYKKEDIIKLSSESLSKILKKKDIIQEFQEKIKHLENYPEKIKIAKQILKKFKEKKEIGELIKQFSTKLIIN